MAAGEWEGVHNNRGKGRDFDGSRGRGGGSMAARNGISSIKYASGGISMSASIMPVSTIPGHGQEAIITTLEISSMKLSDKAVGGHLIRQNRGIFPYVRRITAIHVSTNYSPCQGNKISINSQMVLFCRWPDSEHYFLSLSLYFLSLNPSRTQY